MHKVYVPLASVENILRKLVFATVDFAVNYVYDKDGVPTDTAILEVNCEEAYYFKVIAM